MAIFDTSQLPNLSLDQSSRIKPLPQPGAADAGKRPKGPKFKRANPKGRRGR